MGVLYKTCHQETGEQNDGNVGLEAHYHGRNTNAIIENFKSNQKQKQSTTLFFDRYLLNTFFTIMDTEH